MGELRVWVSLSGTIGRVSNSLINHTKGARSTRELEGQQRLVSLSVNNSLHNLELQGFHVPAGPWFVGSQNG